MISAGVATRDITPPPGLAMSGFAARTGPAQGKHDALSVRALVVDDVAIVTLDVIGVHQDMSRRIRAACCLPDQNVMLHATHTHGGPVSMKDRLSLAADEPYLAELERQTVNAIDAAVADQCPAHLFWGVGTAPGIGKNRRHAEGPVDDTLTVLTLRDEGGSVLAKLVNYACHPVVLGADNRMWTGDYPHYVRTEIEAANPGATALFLTGCIGDINTGHSAKASVTLSPQKARSFDEAERIGKHIAACVAAAPETPLSTDIAVADCTMSLPLNGREAEPLDDLLVTWKAALPTAPEAEAALLRYWVNWGETIAPRPRQPIPTRISHINFGGMNIVGMPGEIFAATGLRIRAAHGPQPLMLAGFCDDNPGYIPPAEEYALGGYEVDEAHRYYGQPAAFAQGAAEQVESGAIALLTGQQVLP